MPKHKLSRVWGIVVSFGFFFALVIPVAQADGVLFSWSQMSIPGLDRDQFQAARKWSPAQVVKTLSTAKDWKDVYLCAVAASQHKEDKAFLKSLVELIDRHEEVGLRNTSRLIIWERIPTGEILFEGRGYVVEDDLFLTSGRANWILRNISKRDFGYIKKATTPADRKTVQARWRSWITGEDVKDVIRPVYGGLSEARSMAALKAMIHSLKPNAEKAALVKDSLKKIYKLDAMPEDPSHQARLCDPDSWTVGILAAITNEKGLISAKDWRGWYERNHKQIRFREKDGTFEVVQVDEDREKNADSGSAPNEE